VPSIPRVLAAMAAGAAVLLLTAGLGVPHAQGAVLAVTAMAVGLWALEPFPLEMSALPILLGLVASGATTPAAATAGFGDGNLMLLVGALVMASAVHATPLGRRLALRLLRTFGPSPAGALAGLMVAAEVLAFVVPATSARTALLLPPALGLADALAEGSGRPEARRLLVLGLVFAASLSGVAFLPAAVANPLTAGLLGPAFGYGLWAAAALPLSLALMAAAYGLLLLLSPVRGPLRTGRREQVDVEIRALGPWTAQETRLCAILTLTLSLWLAERWTGWPPYVPAVLAAWLLALPGLGVLDWSEALRINWGLVLLFGVTLTLGRALQASGASVLLARGLLLLPGVRPGLHHPFLAPLLLALGTEVYHLAFAGVPGVVVTAVPVALALAAQTGGPPHVFGLATGIASLFGFFLVVQTMPGIVAYSAGAFRGRDLARVGLPLSLAAGVLVAVFATTWWRWLGLG
jgi:sodium-dependent dicarboxylate transporter 2/3/5